MKPLRDFRNLAPLTRARAGIVIVGVLLPYVARIPGAFVHGTAWIEQYLDGGLGSFFFIQTFNAMGWGSLFALSFLLRKTSPLLFPSLAGFLFFAYAHGSIDLTEDAHAGVALAFIPMYALPIILVTFILSVVILGRGPRTASRSVDG